MEGPFAIYYNLYWDAAGGTKVGQWPTYNTTRNFPSWQAARNCDARSRVTDLRAQIFARMTSLSGLGVPTKPLAKAGEP
jgi:hypothetical protein